tara:strand:+ start:242 stop:361 length:120 start_codon:yes stop_codon:yes gene_type:complete
MEKSLKQREQLEGYLRDKIQQLSQKRPLVVLLEKKGNDE